MNAASRSVTATSAKKACLASARRVAATRVVRTSANATSTFTLVGKDLQNKLALASKTVGAQLLLALPALAEEAEKEPGKLFDFDFTLPIMAVQFLVLMVFLDKTWFSPVGKVLDDRDENLRNILSGVQDNTGDVKKMEDEASKVVADARTEASNLIADSKKSAETEGTEKLAALKKKLDAQYEAAGAQLVKEEEDARKALEPEIEKLAKQIVEKVA